MCLYDVIYKVEEGERCIFYGMFMMMYFFFWGFVVIFNLDL